MKTKFQNFETSLPISLIYLIKKPYIERKTTYMPTDISFFNVHSPIAIENIAIDCHDIPLHRIFLSLTAQKNSREIIFHFHYFLTHSVNYAKLNALVYCNNE